MSNNLINCLCPRCEYDLLYCWIWSITGDHTWALSRPYPFKVFRGCLPQISLSPRLCHFWIKIFHHATLCFNEVLLNLLWDSFSHYLLWGITSSFSNKNIKKNTLYLDETKINILMFADDLAIFSLSKEYIQKRASISEQYSND